MVQKLDQLNLDDIFFSTSTTLIIGPNFSGKTTLIKNIIEVSKYNKDDIIVYSNNLDLKTISNNVNQVLNVDEFKKLIKNQSNIMDYDSTNFKNKLVIFDDFGDILDSFCINECINLCTTKGKINGISTIVSLQSLYKMTCKNKLNFDYVFAPKTLSVELSRNIYREYFNFVYMEYFIKIHKNLPKYHFVVAHPVQRKIYVMESKIQNETFFIDKFSMQQILSTKLIKPISNRIIIEV